MEDWDPEENGGFPVHGTRRVEPHPWLISSPDTDPSASQVDPLVALEKTTDAQRNITQVQMPRIESLQAVSDQFNSDPYTLSRKIRKRFREEKKVDQAKKAADDAIKGRYSLPATLTLLEDDAETIEKDKQAWAKAKADQDTRERKRRKLPVEVSLTGRPTRPTSTKGTDPVNSLRTRILGNTARQSMSRS